MREITLGQYYPADSLIHKLDPRTKLMATLVYIVSLFLADNLVMYGLGALFLALAVRTSKVPVSYILRGLKPIFLLMIFSVAFNLFLTDGQVVLQVGFLKITWEGLVRAFYMAMRLVFLIMGSSLMTFTTTPNQLTDGMEKGLGFLKKVKFPVHELSMMMSIALRFIPILVDETDKIMKAQMARGADFETGNLIQRAKNMIPLLVPLFISAFRRATDLAMAMESRCYHGDEGRTKMKPLRYGARDRAVYAGLVFYLAVMIALKIFLP